MTATPNKDTERSIAALESIVDGRDPIADFDAIMVTLEQVVAVTLIAAMNQNPRHAARMLNDGLVPGVESRIALFQRRAAQKGRIK